MCFFGSELAEIQRMGKRAPTVIISVMCTNFNNFHSGSVRSGNSHPKLRQFAIETSLAEEEKIKMETRQQVHICYARWIQAKLQGKLSQ